MSSSGSRDSRETMRRPGDGRFGLWFHSHTPALREGSANSSNANSTANSNTSGTSRRRRGPVDWKKALAAATIAGLGYAGGLRGRVRNTQGPPQTAQIMNGLIPIDPYEARQRVKRNTRAPPNTKTTALVPYTHAGLNTRHLASVKPISTHALTALVHARTAKNNQRKKNNKTGQGAGNGAGNRAGNGGGRGTAAGALAALLGLHGLHRVYKRKNDAQHTMNLDAKNSAHASALAAKKREHAAAIEAKTDLIDKLQAKLTVSSAASVWRRRALQKVLQKTQGELAALRLHQVNTRKNTHTPSVPLNAAVQPRIATSSRKKPPPPPPPLPKKKEYTFANKEYTDVISRLFPQQNAKRMHKQTAAEILTDEVIGVLKINQASARVLENDKFQTALRILFSTWKKETPEEFKDRFAALMFKFFLGTAQLGFKHITTNASGDVIYNPETRHVLHLIERVLDHLHYGAYTAAQLNTAATRQANLNIMVPHIQQELTQIRAEYNALLDDTQKHAHVLHAFFQDQSPPNVRTRIASNSFELDKIINGLRKDPDVTKGAEKYQKALRAHIRKMTQARSIDYPAGHVRDAAMFFKAFKTNPFEYLSQQYVQLQLILKKIGRQGLKPSLRELGFAHMRNAKRITREQLHEYGHLMSSTDTDEK